MSSTDGSSLDDAGNPFDDVDGALVDQQPSVRDVPRGIWVLIGALFSSSFASRAQLVALGLLVYRRTGNELDLGLLGLAEFAPLFVLSPLSGTVADRYDRRTVYGIGLAVEAAASAGLAWLALDDDAGGIASIMMLVLVFGAARAFIAPAGRALPIDLAPSGLVERVVALRSVAFQSAGIVGPIVAGFIFSWKPAATFMLASVAYALAIVLVRLVPGSEVRRLDTVPGARQALRDAIDGLRFMRRSPVVFGAITLDLFAVLFGGAVALLPAIGEQRLGVDERAVGALYSTIGVGALITASILAVRPIQRHVGRVLFAVVAVFGAATMVLGLTSSYVVAVGAVLVLSAADAVSVFIRATIVPLATPENMRGRVLAVENIFIGGSNELGAMESGLTAAWWGLVPAVVVGGVGTLAVVAVGIVAFPALRTIDRFEELRASP